MTVVGTLTRHRLLTNLQVTNELRDKVIELSVLPLCYRKRHQNPTPFAELKVIHPFLRLSCWFRLCRRRQD
jgi:hypothetical protein